MTRVLPLEEVLTFTWETTGLPLLAIFTLEVIAGEVENDVDIAVNSLTHGPILVTMKGDKGWGNKPLRCSCSTFKIRT